MRPFVTEYKGDARAAFSALHALPYSLWLDSSDSSHPMARYSYIAALPVETIELQNGHITVTNGHQQTRLSGSSLPDVLRERLKAWTITAETIQNLPPFQGGLAGMMGYDALSETDSADAIPDAVFGIYDQIIAFDHQQGNAWIVTHAESESAAASKKQNLLRMIEAGSGFLPRENPPLLWSALDTRESYKAKVQGVIDLIKAGDVFQANLSQRFETQLPHAFDCFAHYLTLRVQHPAPFGGFLNAGSLRVSSISPEQFLTVRGRQVETRPIKGTRPRGQNEQQDNALREELKSSAKDRAENVMIVDLMRNDLSRVCEEDHLDVTALCQLESFESLHHLVSAVEGTLKDGMDGLNALAACFPGGSVTGAPKIRAMEIIRQFESAPRGPYCGSFVALGFDGSMDSNILIRTVVYNGRTASLNAGGGITLPSSPEEEYEETLTKAKAILKSFETDSEAATARTPARTAP